MTNDELKVIEVKNKMLGGISINDFDGDCPWCNSELVEYDSDDYVSKEYVWYGTCNSCNKSWESHYKMVHYEE